MPELDARSDATIRTEIDPDSGWAIAVVNGRDVLGTVIGFSPRIAVVSFDKPQPLRIGEPVRMRLGLGHGDCSVLARVLHLMPSRDKRAVVAFTLPDVTDAARRDNGRVDYEARVTLVVSDCRVSGDLHQRGRTVDLSIGGVALRTDRALPPRAGVLVRIPLAAQRHPVQLRGEVRWCRHEPEADPSIAYLCGLAWLRLSAEQRYLLSQTVVTVAGRGSSLGANFPESTLGGGLRP